MITREDIEGRIGPPTVDYGSSQKWHSEHAMLHLWLRDGEATLSTAGVGGFCRIHTLAQLEGYIALAGWQRFEATMHYKRTQLRRAYRVANEIAAHDLWTWRAAAMGYLAGVGVITEDQRDMCEWLGEHTALLEEIEEEMRREGEA